MVQGDANVIRRTDVGDFQIIIFGGGRFQRVVSPEGIIIHESAFSNNRAFEVEIQKAIASFREELNQIIDPQEENIIEGKKTNPLIIPALIIGGLLLL